MKLHSKPLELLRACALGISMLTAVAATAEAASVNAASAATPKPSVSANTSVNTYVNPYANTYVEASNIDPALIQALHQATRDVNERTTDLESLTWLSTMSEKLDHIIKDPFYRVRLLEAVYSEAETAGVDPQLVLAVIGIESGFDRYALSHAGAQGLMQVMPFWKDVYEQPHDDLYNPLISLRYGCAILRHYIDKHDNLTDALAAYNGSLGRNTYPDKIFLRLASRWQFKQDSYAKYRAPKLAQR